MASPKCFLDQSRKQGGMEAQARHFRLSLDLQILRTSKMLPQALACVVVQVQLPMELTGEPFSPVRPCVCGCFDHSASALAHAGLQETASTNQSMLLQTKPAHVVRGAETGLEGGHGNLEFQAATMHLATLLAREPQLQAQIHLQDSRCRAAPCEHLLPAPQIGGESRILFPHAGPALLRHVPHAAGPAMCPWGVQTSPCHHCCRRAACRAQPLCFSTMPSANCGDPRQVLLHFRRHGHKQCMF